MVVYNDTFLTNSTNFLDMMTGLGTSIGNPYLVGNLILLAFALVFFLVFSSRADPGQVWISCFFCTTLLAILLAFAGLISYTTIAFPTVGLLLAIIAALTS